VFEVNAQVYQYLIKANHGSEYTFSDSDIIFNLACTSKAVILANILQFSGTLESFVKKFEP
jgi:hypothetical protein